MILKFKSGIEVVKIDMDRKNKKLVVTSSKKSYIPIQAQWKMLFDPGKEKQQEELTDKLDDKQFVHVLVEGFKKFGYVLTSKTD